MSKDIHKWSDGRYTLMFDEHTFFVWDNEKDERMTALNVTKRLNEQQDTIFKLQDLCGESDGENAKLRIENKRLCDEIKLLKPTNIEQYEQIQKLQEENEQLKIANARWLDKSLQDRQIRYSNANHKELTKKYLQLKEENDILKQKLRKNYIANKQYDEMKRLQKENEQQERRIEVLENLLTNIGVKWIDDDD